MKTRQQPAATENQQATIQLTRRELLWYGVSLTAMSALGGSVIPAATAQSAATPQASKPNIVFILMDNLGYGEVGCYGGGELRGAPTPRIDKLASEGTR
jgi:Sulfatase